MSAFVRKPSGLESFFIDLDECGCNMTFHFFLKLDREPSVDEINLASKCVLETHGGINLMYVNGSWHKSDYVPECSVKHLEGEESFSSQETHIDFHKHTIELSILHMTESDDWYLCFDFFHGAVDGRSGIQFVYDFFDILNGNPVLENDFTVSDCEMVYTPDKAARRRKKIPFTVFPKCVSSDWKPSKDGKQNFYVMQKGVCVRSLAARLSWAVGQCFSNKSSKMIIPVDVRRYAGDKEKSFFGNLFVPIFVDAATIRNVDDLCGEIVSFVKQRPLLHLIAGRLAIYSKIWPAIRQIIIKFFIPIVMSSKKFIYCALVSSLGDIDSNKLETENFKVEDFSVTFATFPFTAFNVISLQYKGKTNTTVAWNSGRVTDAAVMKLLENIENCLCSKEA